MPLTELQERCREFLAVVDSIYGVYLDATHGFGLVYERILNAQQDRAARTHTSIEDQDSLPLWYGIGDPPDDPDAAALHAVTQGECKARNIRGGDNWIFLANVCLVSIYQFWEDQFREAIAAALGKDKNELPVPVMGDIRHLRHSILHNGGTATSDVERCKVLRWFRRGERIALTADQVQTTVYEIQRAIQEISTQQAKLVF